jgi:hypothetical protein
MELRVHATQKEALGRCPETPAPAGVFGRLLRVLRWAELRHRVIRDVDDLPDHLRAEIGLPPSVTADQPVHPIGDGRVDQSISRFERAQSETRTK